MKVTQLYSVRHLLTATYGLIGMALLADLAAYDFGYISAGEFLSRIQNTLETMEKLERYLGHFYNWYDTRTLKPLHPQYISSVDSGNLAGSLLTLLIFSLSSFCRMDFD